MQEFLGGAGELISIWGGIAEVDDMIQHSILETWFNVHSPLHILYQEMYRFNIFPTREAAGAWAWIETTGPATMYAAMYGVTLPWEIVKTVPRYPRLIPMGWLGPYEWIQNFINIFR